MARVAEMAWEVCLAQACSIVLAKVWVLGYQQRKPYALKIIGAAFESQLLQVRLRQ